MSDLISFVHGQLASNVLSRLQASHPAAAAAMSLLMLNTHRLPGLFQVISEQSLRIIWSLIQIILKIWRVVRHGNNTKEPIKKICVIQSITEDKTINLIYPKVLWYINNQTNIDNETHLSIKQAANDIGIMQSIPQMRSASIEYGTYKIDYTISTSIMTIHADHEYKREVFIITLSTDISPDKTIYREFIDHCVGQYDQIQAQTKWVQKTFRNDTNGNWVGELCQTKRRMDTVILKEGQMQAFQKDIDEFIAGEDWYVSRDVPYTRRYMFYGPPGTGKTSTFRAISQYTKRDKYCLLLSLVKSDKDLITLFGKIPHKNAVVIIEDIDCASRAAHSRNATPPPVITTPDDTSEPPTSLTLSGLLNAIEGDNVHGQIMIITTNRPDVLDEALTRAGRIDQSYNFSNCDAYQVNHLYSNFFNQGPPTQCPTEVIKMSPAEVSGIFIQEKTDPAGAWRSLLAKCDQKIK